MTAWLDDLRTRLQFGQGSATLLLVIAEHDTVLDETRRLLVALLRITPLSVEDLGVGSIDAGPRRWAQWTGSRPANAYVLTATPASPLSLRPMVVLYNAERELLRQLAGPVVLLVSRATEEAIRQHAADFFTWVAQSYVLPSTRELAALAKQLGVAPAVVEPTVLEEEPMRFLHISDLHLRPQTVKRYDQDRVLRGLVELLKRDRASFALDLIFVTGDLANTGKAEEYALVVELLKRLMEVTGVPPEHMFVVPGNHDVDREVGRWLLRTLGKDEESIAFFEEPKSRAFHLKKLEAYAESMRAFLGERRALGLAVGEEAVEMVEVRGARLAVASFNSAWFAQGDDDRGKLWLGEPNVDRAGQRVADEEAPFAVALMHHPFEELHEIERDNVEHYFERSFEVVLRGHLHKDKTRAIATQRGGFVEVTGPAAYQGSQWPNGCFLGEIRTKARTVRIRPCVYASGADGWVLDAKVFPDDEKDGYCHTFVIAEKRRLKSAVVKQREDVAVEAVKAASPAQQRKVAEELGVTRPGEAPPLDLVQQTAKAARSRASDQSFAQVVASLGLAGTGAGLAVAMMDELSEEDARVSIGEPEFLEHSLLHVGRAFLGARAALGTMTINTAIQGIYAALGVILNPPSRGQAQHAIFFGAPNAPCVVYVTQVDNFSQQRTIAAGLLRIDQYMSDGAYTHGALIVLDALPPTETEPQLEHATTPAGRDVLLLRL